MIQGGHVERSNLAIGVFDSGMGGLTVLRALRQHLPNESFVYLGDTARLPYGTKSALTVQHYATQMTKVLVEKQIKALVIACNTATTAALPHLQGLYPDLPVLGVVEPGALAATEISKFGHILVLATETTIASRAYHQAIHARRPEAKVDDRACSLLVALAEEGIIAHDIARLTLKHYLQGSQHEDTVLLGCTHFPVFKPLIQELLPKASIVDSATATAHALAQALTEQNLLTQSTQSTTIYLVTDAVKRFCRIGEIFLQEPILAENVQLIDV